MPMESLRLCRPLCDVADEMGMSGERERFISDEDAEFKRIREKKLSFIGR